MITRAFGDFAAIAPQSVTDIPVCASEGSPQARMPVRRSSRGRPSANPKAKPEKTFAAKVFVVHEFGYRRITVEHPLRESNQFDDARLATLRFALGGLEAPMRWLCETYGSA